jgi:hypothetical protein
MSVNADKCNKRESLETRSSMKSIYRIFESVYTIALPWYDKAYTKPCSVRFYHPDETGKVGMPQTSPYENYNDSKGKWEVLWQIGFRIQVEAD